jgi:hypothetical protein
MIHPSTRQEWREAKWAMFVFAALTFTAVCLIGRSL